MQIAELSTRPDPARIDPIRNPPQMRSFDFAKYRGNKPTGGLWTSTYTPDDEFISDWQRGRRTNALIQMAYPERADLADLVAYGMMVRADARVLEIVSMSDAIEFTRECRIACVETPDLGPLGVAITGELTDWQRAAGRYDGIHLTPEAADELAWAMVHDGEATAFHTWNCESTLWTRWVFECVEELK